MVLKEEHLEELREEDRRDAQGYDELGLLDDCWEANGFASAEDYYSWRGA